MTPAMVNRIGGINDHVATLQNIHLMAWGCDALGGRVVAVCELRLGGEY